MSDTLNVGHISIQGILNNYFNSHFLHTFYYLHYFRNDVHFCKTGIQSKKYVGTVVHSNFIFNVHLQNNEVYTNNTRHIIFWV